MQLILAIDSDPRRSEQLKALVRARLAVDLVQATSAGEGLHALKDRVPDLILTAPLLSPFDDGVLDEYLRDLGAAATHVQTLRIPMLSAPPKKKSTATRLFGLGRKKKPTSSATPDGCDPKVFADEIAHYLTRSLEERSASAIKSAATPAPADPLPSRPDALWIEDVVQPGRLIEPEAPIEEFTAPIATEPAPIQTSPVVEQVFVPGTILGLRPTPVEARHSEIMVEPDPLVAEPEVWAFVEPEVPFVEPEVPFVEPDVRAFVEPDVRAFVEPDVHAFVEPEVHAFVEPEVHAFVEPEAHAFVEPEPPVIIEPVVPTADSLAAVNPQSVSAPSAPQTPGGTSPSFEAALAAIRAAWAKPEDKKPVVSARPNEPASGSPKPKLAGAAEVDLTNQIDALEDVGADGLAPAAADESSPDESKTSAERRKVDKARKQPEKARGQKLRGSDGRDDWGAFDPNQRPFSTLVNTLDEVTEDEVTTVRATTIVR